jgi:hypothetical protein
MRCKAIEIRADYFTLGYSLLSWTPSLGPIARYISKYCVG